MTGDPNAARAIVDAMVDDIAHCSGTRGRVLVRRDDSRTWMEVYEGVTDPARFEQELAAAVLRHDATRWAEQGLRHTEPFVARDKGATCASS